MVTTRAMKRRRLAENARIAAGSRPDQPQSTFLKLPPEIRDQIYTFVFENDAMEFFCKSFTCICVPSHVAKEISGCHSPDISGLPLWMLTCKQILHEALEWIGKTHTFELSGLISPPDEAEKVVPNPLIFSKNVIREICLDHTWGTAGFYWLYRSCRTENNIHYEKPDFLYLLQQVQVTDLCLKLYWDCPVRDFIDGFRWTYKQHEEVLLESWTPYWNGKFRKVVIEVMVSFVMQKASENEKLQEEAGKLAVRLVGSGGVATWCDLDCISDDHTKGKRVIVECKI